MKVLIELPTWLGDAVMTTPAIETIVKNFRDIEITLLGSFVSIEALKNHPKVTDCYVLDKSFLSNYRTLRKLREFDIFFSFRESYRAKLIKSLIKSKKKYQYNKKRQKAEHQVEKYNNFVNYCLNIRSTPGKLNLQFERVITNKKNKLLGINPGASYGSAKRWYPNEFASVAIALSNDYDIIIFGGAKEIRIAADIENYLVEKGVTNYQNLAGKTNIKKLMTSISSLDLFVSGDSGPMHLAAAFQIPTVTIFGPTKHNETSQWKNEKSKIVKKDLACQPCMQRKCPLKHHNCMKQINAAEVLRSIYKL